jgi:hypothetical protein
MLAKDVQRSSKIAQLMWCGPRCRETNKAPNRREASGDGIGINAPEHRVVERDNLLDGNLLSRRLVKSGADDTVCALANNILDVILLADVEGDLAGSGLRRGARRRHVGDVVWEV